jgi:hypothetical protein
VVVPPARISEAGALGEVDFAATKKVLEFVLNMPVTEYCVAKLGMANTEQVPCATMKVDEVWKLLTFVHSRNDL